jgi:hypothetical protein
MERAGDGLVEGEAVDGDTQQVSPRVFRLVEEAGTGDLVAWLAWLPIGGTWLMAAASGRTNMQNESSVAARDLPRPPIEL